MHGTLVIIGSGPVGMASALLLKDRFERVVVLERQSKEKFLRKRGFTFPIVFSPAARAVLRQIGVLDAMNQERSPYFGVVVHKRVLGAELTWTAKRAGIYSHWRNHIVATLYDRLAAEGITVHFDSELEDIDFTDNFCTEATLGSIPFDLLLGADGVSSQTRKLLARSHPGFGPDAFNAEVLDHWYAYRLPAEGLLDERYGSGDHGYALHVHTDNLRQDPEAKFRVITVAMTQPRPEVSVVIKHGPDLSLERVRRLNAAFFGSMVDDDVLDQGWADGVGGEYRHVMAPTFHHGSALLVGDAAHGFEGNGDLINLGISSVAALPDLLDNSTTIPDALAAYDATVGGSLREYSEMALRRSLEQINIEVAAFEIGALLRLNGHHPSMWGIYEDDFEICSYMKRYERDRNRLRNRAAALAGGLVVAGASRLRGRRA
ncbi:MAG: NAD(P)/FAD-dependent oxidoreductase [Acidimicrobiia bacterium]|nr:NAD(P)/FAD-dependent oxidoreductase [Acidimicrobiia bacterium]